MVRCNGGFLAAVARGDEALAERIEAALPVEVTREGEALAELTHSLETTVRLLRAVSVVMGIAAALSILTVMFALVQRRGGEMAILRCLGFRRRSLVVYVLGQAGAVTALGFAFSLAATAVLLRGLRLGAVGVTIAPGWFPIVERACAEIEATLEPRHKGNVWFVNILESKGGLAMSMNIAPYGSGYSGSGGAPHDTTRFCERRVWTRSLPGSKPSFRLPRLTAFARACSVVRPAVSEMAVDGF